MEGFCWGPNQKEMSYTPPVPMQNMDGKEDGSNNNASQAYSGTMVTPEDGIPTYAQQGGGQQSYVVQPQPHHQQQQQQQQYQPQQQGFQSNQQMMGGPNAETSKGCCMSCLTVCGKIVLVVIALIILGSIGTVIVLEGSPYLMEYGKMESTSPLVTSGKFNNGFQYTVLKNGYKKGKFVTYLCVDAGSIDEDDTQLGIAHFFEHCAFDNTRDYKGRNGLIWALLKVREEEKESGSEKKE
eukprot:TRINITY_DN408_c0_g1_i2.p1 TRINITY_DN408_c0_g1~~TRINITY_DN408_c0_g1_i2.p1  ORF type:complete len:239 (-),score=69.24 TRINITY_DN408_c0_g1_i2:2-718(-)